MSNSKYFCIIRQNIDSILAPIKVIHLKGYTKFGS